MTTARSTLTLAMESSIIPLDQPTRIMTTQAIRTIPSKALKFHTGVGKGGFLRRQKLIERNDDLSSRW